MLKKWLHRLIDRLVSASLSRTNVLARLDDLKKQQDEAILPWIDSLKKQQDEALLPWLHNLQKDLDGSVHPWLECLKKQQDEALLPWLHNLQEDMDGSVHPWLECLKKQQDEALLPWLHNLQKDLDGSVHPWLECLKKQQDEALLPWLHNLQNSLNETQVRLHELSCLISAVKEDFIIRQVQEKQTICSDISYRAFEDKMRGDVDLIRERLELYESVIKRVIRNNEGDRVFALDLGCGRGEFLDLLSQEYKIDVMGVDMDEEMIEACRERNLTAVHGDIFDFLKNQESSSVDLISMIQVAEHIPTRILFMIMKEIRRVLRDGGACIIETPNPENLIVGACNFYLDPSHVNILPPGLLDLLAKCAGFEETEVVRMHWYNAVPTDHLDKKDGIQASIMRIGHFVNNFGDYAVIGYLAK